MTAAVAPFLNLAGDAPDIDPADFAERLLAAVKAVGPEVDEYARGGAVAAFEARLAAALGKERAMIAATGTLANLLALEAHAKGRGARVVVQAEGHIANDSGDGAAAIGGLSLQPVPHADFTAAALAAQIERAESARVASPIAAVVVESPLRRGLGATVPWDEQGEICALARRHGIALHLDGARLFIAAGWLGRSVADLAAPYDTVYVSLYKYFGVPFGAALAGPAALIDGLYHARRRHGGGLNQMWPVALLADAALDDLAESWRRIAAQAEAVVDGLAAAGVPVGRIDHGTNVYRLPADDTAAIAARAKAAGVKLPALADGVFPLKANATWLAQPSAEVVARLLSVLQP